MRFTTRSFAVPGFDNPPERLPPRPIGPSTGKSNGRACVERHAARGFTLVELMVVLALLGVALVLVTASVQRVIQSQRLRGTAEAVSAQLQHARLSAIAQQRALGVSVINDGAGGQCQITHAGDAADCRCLSPALPSCDGGATLIKALRLTPRDALRMTSTATTIRFDPRLGTATPAGRFSLRTPDGREIQNVVSLTGRVRRCAPSGLEIGLPRCPAA